MNRDLAATIISCMVGMLIGHIICLCTIGTSFDHSFVIGFFNAVLVLAMAGHLK
jgi:hypothetical protein